MLEQNFIRLIINKCKPVYPSDKQQTEEHTEVYGRQYLTNKKTAFKRIIVRCMFCHSRLDSLPQFGNRLSVKRRRTKSDPFSISWDPRAGLERTIRQQRLL